MAAETASAIQTPHPLDAAFLRSMFEGAEVAIVACDVAGRVLASNAATARLFAARGGVRNGESYVALFPEDQRVVVEEYRELCIDEGKSVEWLGGLAIGEPGNAYSVWFTPVAGAEGATRGMALSIRDVTARQKLRKALEKRARLSSLGALSGAVAHHYSNLICSIATSLDYANNMNTMAAMRRALQRVGEPINRATQISRQLLAFAQADHRHRDMADLTEMVLYFCDENEERFRKHHVELELVWTPTPVRPVPRDSILLVLKNLADNALEAMRGGGKLRVTLEPRDEFAIRLTVADTGPGIRPEMLERLFEPFVTSKGELSAGCAGTARNTGLGLAVAHGLLAAMGGSITARNRPEGGAIFEIILPVQTQSEDESGPEEGPGGDAADPVHRGLIG